MYCLFPRRNTGRGARCAFAWGGDGGGGRVAVSCRSRLPFALLAEPGGAAVVAAYAGGERGASEKASVEDFEVALGAASSRVGGGCGTTLFSLKNGTRVLRYAAVGASDAFARPSLTSQSLSLNSSSVANWSLASTSLHALGLPDSRLRELCVAWPRAVLELTAANVSVARLAARAFSFAAAQSEERATLIVSNGSQLFLDRGDVPSGLALRIDAGGELRGGCTASKSSSSSSDTQGTAEALTVRCNASLQLTANGRAGTGERGEYAFGAGLRVASFHGAASPQIFERDLKRALVAFFCNWVS